MTLQEGLVTSNYDKDIVSFIKKGKQTNDYWVWQFFIKSRQTKILSSILIKGADHETTFYKQEKMT